SGGRRRPAHSSRARARDRRGGRCAARCASGSAATRGGGGGGDARCARALAAGARTGSRTGLRVGVAASARDEGGKTEGHQRQEVSAAKHVVILSPAPSRRLGYDRGFVELRSGAVIADKLRLVEPLGQGGMGVVWSARHLALDTDVAVKFVRPERALA